LCEEEKRQILEEFNHTTLEYIPVKRVHELFADQVEETPDNNAVVGPLPVKHRTYMTYMTYISYRELNEKSDRLAHLLIEKGVQPDTIVGIKMERSVEMVIGILGILKAGGGYLPIDPDYPEERINYMLKDSNAKILLTSREIASLSSSYLHLPHAPATSLAYLIYTSGSTGRPKGVIVEHRNLTAYINAFEKEFDLRPDDTVIQQASYAFDAFVEELYPILLKGGKLVITGKELIRDIQALCRFIAQHQGTIITCSPQLLNELNNSPGLLASLRILISGGDRLKAEYIGNLIKIGDVYNTYGPTEATVCATYYRCPNHSEVLANVSIGKPITNYQLYILDKYNNILPLGVPGELYIAGAGVTRGYLNNPQLTSEKFIFATKTQRHKEVYFPLCLGALVAKLYKTGDLARWMPDGNIEFLGRIDRQVKVRGYRIELGEIENRLTALDIIRKAIVVEVQRKSGQNFLAAYVVCQGPIETAEVKSRLARQLPGYMIPTYIMEVDEIPLTFSGKVDQKRLPPPGAVSDQPYAPPGSDIEKLVAETWKQVLEKDRVGLDENFFDLGGTSLDIFKVNARMKEIFKKQIPTVMMFKHSTIRSLARYIEEKENQAGIPGEKHKEMINAAARSKTMLNHINGFEIAVIGMAAQFPGARDIHEFWENLKNGIESISFFTDEELQAEGIDTKILENPNYIKARGITAGVEYFDSSFFGYASTEAQIMDPQVRIFLQCVWHGLEDAGYDPFSYQGRIGLYAGASPNLSWEGLTSLSGLARGFSGFMIAQLADKDFMCTHISYKLNLNGPSVSIQTACSTSLAAIHWAVRGLLTGECEMALAGGVSIAFPPKQGYLYQEGMIFSPDGHNKTFDAEAAGSVFGDGVGVVVLKPLAYATRDRDHIYAIIKGSAINNDGCRKVGYTAPSIDGQAEVIKSAQLTAEVEPGSITYMEAHGTATPLGDTVEIEALKQAFNTSKKGFCGIGTVKSNIGHLYSAAGTAGFIKTVLALKHRLIPPSLHFKTPNPGINFENTPFYVNTGLKEWKSDGYPLRAGVSSFGIGGTNVHVILEEAPAAGESVNQWVSGQRTDSRGGSLCPPSNSRQYQLILLSAKTQSALDKMTENLTAYFKKNLLNPGPTIADMTYTLQVGRKHFPYRRMAVCAALDAEPQKLALDIRRIPAALVKEENRPIVFMFCGQGSQYVNMGIDLYRTEPIFRQEMDRCFEILKPLMGYDIKEILYPPATCHLHLSPDINHTEVAQPLIFTIEYALAKLLIRWGIKPQAMIGYSFGEYIAACIAGVFSLEDSLKLITIRAQLIGQTPAGAMTSVPLPEKELKPHLNENLWLAIINGPTCIVSGAKAHVEAFEKEMKKKRIMCVPLNMSRAIHSLKRTPYSIHIQCNCGMDYGRTSSQSQLLGRSFVFHGSVFRRS
jgi:amino acid adenylation domain-containing protein